MQSAKRMHSIKSKKRELRGAQRESKKKVEKLKEVSYTFLSVSPNVKFTLFSQNCLKCISSLEKLKFLQDR